MQLAVFAILGVLLAAAHAAALQHNVELYVAGASVVRASLFHLTRIGVVAACFAIIAILGFHPLLAALAGFVSAQLWIGARRQRELT